MKRPRRSSKDLRGGRWRTDAKETSDRQVGPVVGMALVGVKEVVAGDLRIHGLVESDRPARHRFPGQADHRSPIARRNPRLGLHGLGLRASDPRKALTLTSPPPTIHLRVA